MGLDYNWLIDYYDNNNNISAAADGGLRSLVCARLTLRSAPHRLQRKFIDGRVCKVAFKHLPIPSEVISEVL